MAYLSGSLLNRRYRIQELLGAGGMAEVYAALDERLGRRVAVKLLRTEHAADPAVVARFLHEGSIAAGLAHPHIVMVFDAGQELLPRDTSARPGQEADGAVLQARPYLVLELIEGPTLAGTLAQAGGRWPVHRALELVQQIAAAVAYAHHQGVLHCDLKPTNVLLTPESQAKVADFGLARAVAAPQPQDSQVWDSLPYLAPEVLAGAPPSPASDVYSLGVLLHELLTGTRPSAAAPGLAEVQAGALQIPGPLAEIVRRALIREPHRRYTDAAEFLADLQRFEAATLVPTRPWPIARGASDETWHYPPARHGVRSRAGIRPLFLAAAASAVAAAALLAGSTFQEGRYAAVPSPSGPAMSTPTAVPTMTPEPSPSPTPGPTPIPRLEVPVAGQHRFVSPPREERNRDDDRPTRARGGGRGGRHD